LDTGHRTFWHSRPVLITGATGFLGSWLTLWLVEAGAQVVALVRDWSPQSNFARSRLDKRVTVARGSVTDFEAVQRVLNEYSVDTMFHLAAQAIVGTAHRSPLSTFETNVKGTWNVLEAARQMPSVQRLIVASSDKAYGTYPEDQLPYREDYPLRGSAPYEVSKSCADWLAQSYFQTYFRWAGRPFVGVTRCANIFGGGDLNFGRIVPDVAWALVNDRDPVIRSHGQHVRDFLYVRDAVNACVTLAEKLGEVSGEAFNFGLEHPLTVLQLTQMMVQLSGKAERKPIVQGTAPAEGEILAQWVSCAKARERLGWRPSATLEEGLTDTLLWYEKWRDIKDDRKADIAELNRSLLRR
jgi:CDP-glucose 4,6-dehydratase